MSEGRTLFEKIWDAHVVRAGGRRAGRPLHRPAPGPRGDLAPGLHRPARARPPRAPAGPDRGDGRPQHSRPRGPPWSTTDGARQQLQQLDDELPGVRHHALRPRQPAAGHRPRDRPGARAHAAGHDDRLRRQPHRDARRVRRARLRHRHERGGARARDAVPAAEPAEDVRGARRRAARAGRHRQGHHPRAHRARSASAAATGHVFEYTRRGRSAPCAWRSA